MLPRAAPAKWLASSARSVRAVALALATLIVSGVASAQVADVELGSGAFWEPSPSSKLTVFNPHLALGVMPTDWLTVRAGWEADIVSGASEAIKAGPLPGVDVVSSATHFSDTRHVVSGTVALARRDTRLSVGYSYGTEKDYRSQAITVSAATDFLQKNTQIELAYAHGFDKVCTSEFSEDLAPSQRLAMSDSNGCFGSDTDRESRDVDLDNMQTAWTQAWTPVLTTQLVLTGALQHGFLGNPYREVVISPTGSSALENHPENRARIALAMRVKYHLRPIETAFSFGVRGYRDTWDVLAQTYELEGERYIFPWLRILARGRIYTQSGALFWSDDYTGGEPVTGPRGQYWTGDRELSPLQSYLLGGRLLAAWQGRPGARIIGAFLDLSASFGVDLMKTHLESFTWGGLEPDDTVAVIGLLNVAAAF
jgi:hypothetical protein